MAKIFKSLFAKNVVIPPGELENYLRADRLVVWLAIASWLGMVAVIMGRNGSKSEGFPMIILVPMFLFILMGIGRSLLASRLRWADRVRVGIEGDGSTYLTLCLQPPYTGIEDLSREELELFIAQVKRIKAYSKMKKSKGSNFVADLRAIHASAGNHTAETRKL